MSDSTCAPTIVREMPRSFREHVERLRLLWRLALHRKFKPLVKRLAPLIPPGSTVLDVGGNHGRFAAELALALGGSLTVHAFEPLAYNFAMLRLVAKRHRNVTAHHFGLSDRDEELNLYTPVLTSGVVEHGGSFIAQTPPRAMDARRPVLVQTPVIVRHGDRVLDELGVQRFSFAKIDVEGHEAAVLRGLQKRIERDHPLLFIEVLPLRPDRAAATDEMTKYLAGLGYHAALDDDERDRWRFVDWKDIAALVRTKGQDILAWHGDGPGAEAARRALAASAEARRPS